MGSKRHQVRARTRHLSGRALVLAMLAFCPYVSQAADAPSPSEEDAHIRRVSESVFSPFCPGRTLEDCPSTAASELKQKLRAKLREGASEEDLLTYLYGLYGREIRALPDPGGFGVVAWLGPGLFLILGFSAVAVWLRSRRGVADVPAPTQVSSAARARIERELLP